MAKKRKTRQEKIILQLKKELAAKEAAGRDFGPAKPERQEPVLRLKKSVEEKTPKRESEGKSGFNANPRLVKIDLLKSLAFTLLILSLEIVLYWRLK